MARPFRRTNLYKSPAQLRLMLPPAAAAISALDAMRELAAPGVSLLELDAAAEEAITRHGAKPNFKQVPGYHHTICANVNEHVVHGIPTDYRLQPGDMVSLDVGAEIGGWNSDCAITVCIPDPADKQRSDAISELSHATEQAMWAGIARLASAKHVGEIGEAVERYIKANSDYNVLEDYIGHGIGRDMHEDPQVHNVATRRPGPEVKPGMCLAIEPIISAGTIDTYVEADDWTVTIADGSLSCQWEHSVAVHAGGIWVLTAADGGAAGLAPFGVTPVPIP